MYARVVRFTTSPGDEAPAKEIAEHLAPQIRHQPGCEQVVVFGDAEGEGGLFVLWDSEEHADSAAAIISPQLQQHLAGHVSAPPVTGLFPVLSR